MAAIPDFNVPSGGVAQVKIIDTTSRISKIPTTLIYKPDVEGYEYINDGPCWSFLVESPSGKKVLFDLGTPKDFADLAPVVVNMSKQVALEITVEKNTAEILEGHGVALSDIGSIIWR